MEVFVEYCKAFVVGGGFCAIAQIFIDYTKLTPARVMVAFVVLGVVLGALGVYQPLVEFAGGGASVPLLGFGNTIAKGTLEAVREKGLFGALTGGLSAASGGISAAILMGLVAALVFPSKDIV